MLPKWELKETSQIGRVTSCVCRGVMDHTMTRFIYICHGDLGQKQGTFSPWARAQNFTCRYNLGDEGYTYFLNKYMSVEDILV